MTAITLSALIQRFFTDRLYTQMGASQHTIASYRDTFRMLLQFASEETNKPPTSLGISDLNVNMIGNFLNHIENNRNNSARSRNTRLAAIRSFFRYVAIHEPSYMLHSQKVLSIPSKRYIKRNVDFLNTQEMQALLNAPNRTTWIGRRDHAILTIALQTGLRSSELINLCCNDVILDTGSHVRCEGKGRKQRSTPLRKDTVKIIKDWLKEREGSLNDPLFPTIRGGRLSRDALEHIVKRHTSTASKTCQSLIGKRVSPHVLRHSTAMDLLHHGVDHMIIALWLGHESVETTQIYIHADLKMKERALAKMSSPTTSPSRYKPDDTLLKFLENL